MTRRVSLFAAVLCASTVLAALPAVSQPPESLRHSPASGAFRAAISGSPLALLWPQMVAVQAKYLPHCQDARLLAEVSALIERETSLHVLTFTHEVVFVDDYQRVLKSLGSCKTRCLWKNLSAHTSAV